MEGIEFMAQVHAELVLFGRFAQAIASFLYSEMFIQANEELFLGKSIEVLHHAIELKNIDLWFRNQIGHEKIVGLRTVMRWVFILKLFRKTISSGLCIQV